MDAEQRQILKENRYHLEEIIEYDDKLTEYLRDYKMFNSYMWNDIHSISDVLELLPTRGPKAFRKFIKILRESGYDAEADLLEKPYLPVESSDKLFYKMSSIPLGYCLIINNMEFDEPAKHAFRKGSDIDANSLKDFFEKAGFEVTIKPNLYSYEMNNYLIKFSRKDFTRVDSMILIIMSHGGRSDDNRDILYGKDGGVLYKEDIYKMFSNEHCKELQSKPKVFFFIACRGDLKFLGVPKRRLKEESLDSHPTGSSNADLEILPQLSDMLIIHSTLPYHVTVRDHEKGTYFCQALVSVLNEYYKTHDLETMIKLVNQELEGKVSEAYRITVQTVQSESTVWKKKLMLHRRY